MGPTPSSFIRKLTLPYTSYILFAVSGIMQKALDQAVNTLKIWSKC